MKAFAELYAALDQTTKTNEKIRALLHRPRLSLTLALKTVRER